MSKFISAVLVLLYIYSNPKHFKVGECVQFNTDSLEKWETNPYSIQKIVEIGHFSYKTNTYDDGNWKYMGPFDKIYFHDQKDYMVVVCPSLR